jgi:hypothetical protein
MSMRRVDIGRSMFDVQTRMTNGSSAEEVRALIKLKPYATCGFRAHHIYQQPTNCARRAPSTIS